MAQTSECNIGAIVLAAGQARRMGALKQLLPWRGTTIVEQVVDCVVASGVSEVVVVVGHHAREVSEKLIERPVRVVPNPDYQKGIASSLVCGLKALSGNCRGIMVVLGDQPALEPETLRRLIDTFCQHASIVVPTFKGQPGNPVIFPARYRNEMLTLTGDRGARPVVEAHPKDVATVEVDTDSILRDIDDPETYRLLRDRSASNTP